MDQGRVEFMHLAHCLVGTELKLLTPLIDIIGLPVVVLIHPLFLTKVRCNVLCYHVNKYGA